MASWQDSRSAGRDGLPRRDGALGRDGLPGRDGAPGLKGKWEHQGCQNLGPKRDGNSVFVSTSV